MVRQKNETQRTGGGSPYQSELNKEEEAILNLINKKKIEGIENVRESEINFCFNKENISENIGHLDVQDMDEQNCIIVEEEICDTQAEDIVFVSINLFLRCYDRY